MDYSPQESLANTINTMGTLFGVHPIVDLWQLNMQSSHASYENESWILSIKCWWFGGALFLAGYGEKYFKTCLDAKSNVTALQVKKSINQSPQQVKQKNKGT